MPEHLLQLKSKVRLSRGWGLPWCRPRCGRELCSLRSPSLWWLSCVCQAAGGCGRPRSAPLPSQGPEHIYCSCVSSCGSWVAYSTASRFHLYRVQYEGDGVSVKKVRRVAGRPAAGAGWWVAAGSQGSGTAGTGGTGSTGGSGRRLPALLSCPSRSPKRPRCCSRPTSCSSPPTPAASSSPPLEAPSTSSSCWSGGAANTCTRFGRPQVRAGGEPGGCWGVPEAPSSIPAVGAEGRAGSPLSCPGGCGSFPPRQPLPRVCATLITRPQAGEQDTQIGRGAVGLDVPWGWDWGSSCTCCSR